MTDTTIHLTIQQLDEDLFLATSPDIPGLIAEGRTVREATEIAQDVARKIAESCLEHGDPLPKALTEIAEKELVVPVSLP